MISNDDYQIIPKNIAGAQTKNRFRYEMYYGILLWYELYSSGKEDFFVIFDYACDLEIGQDDTISFYQLKSKDRGNFTLQSLLHSKKGEKSILQTLVDLDVSSCVSTLNIVSNAAMTKSDLADKKFSNMESFCFEELSEDDKLMIGKSVSWPKTCDLHKVHYIVSDLCLKKPSNSLDHYTNVFLSKIFPKALHSINSFTQAIVSTIFDKACYEYDSLTLDEAILHKGVTKANMDSLLSDYKETFVYPSVIDIRVFSDALSDFGMPLQDKIEAKESFETIFGCGYIETSVKTILESVRLAYRTMEYGGLSDIEAVNKAINDNAIDFGDYAYNESARFVLALYAAIM